MQVIAHPDRPLQVLSDDEIKQLVQTRWLPTVMIYDLHQECCSRRFAGWSAIAKTLKDRFESMRGSELRLELEALTRTFAKASNRDASGTPRPKGMTVAGTATPAARIAETGHVVPKPVQKSEPVTWIETAQGVRHAKVHADAGKVANLFTASEWAEHSPMKVLGYSVSATTGLNEVDRHEFLEDFCRSAVLPKGLPKGYAAPWGAPGTKDRVIRTAKHLRFLIRNFEKQDDEKFARAIACWQHDFNFLKLKFGNLLNHADWDHAWSHR